MHLKYLLFLTALPLAAAAQDQTSAPARKPAANTEFAFNIGHAADNAWMSLGHGGYLRGAVSLLKNRGAFQYGLTVEGGTNSDDQWYVAPGVVANYRGAGKAGYWYAGGMAAYTCTGEMMNYRISFFGERNLAHGYSFGLQAGRVQQISRRFSLTAELAVRSSQTWKTYTHDFYGRTSVPRIIVYLPLTIGFRYALH